MYRRSPTLGMPYKFVLHRLEMSHRQRTGGLGAKHPLRTVGSQPDLHTAGTFPRWSTCRQGMKTQIHQRLRHSLLRLCCRQASSAGRTSTCCRTRCIRSAPRMPCIQREAPLSESQSQYHTSSLDTSTRAHQVRYWCRCGCLPGSHPRRLGRHLPEYILQGCTAGPYLSMQSLQQDSHLGQAPRTGKFRSRSLRPSILQVP